MKRPGKTGRFFIINIITVTITETKIDQKLDFKDYGPFTNFLSDRRGLNSLQPTLLWQVTFAPHEPSLNGLNEIIFTDSITVPGEALQTNSLNLSPHSLQYLVSEGRSTANQFSIGIYVDINVTIERLIYPLLKQIKILGIKDPSLCEIDLYGYRMRGNGEAAYTVEKMGKPGEEKEFQIPRDVNTLQWGERECYIHYNFKDCFPISVNEYDYNHKNYKWANVKTVTFGYRDVDIEFDSKTENGVDRKPIMLPNFPYNSVYGDSYVYNPLNTAAQDDSAGFATSKNVEEALKGHTRNDTFNKHFEDRQSKIYPEKTPQSYEVTRPASEGSFLNGNVVTERRGIGEKAGYIGPNQYVKDITENIGNIKTPDPIDRLSIEPSHENSSEYKTYAILDRTKIKKDLKEDSNRDTPGGGIGSHLVETRPGQYMEETGIQSEVGGSSILSEIVNAGFFKEAKNMGPSGKPKSNDFTGLSSLNSLIKNDDKNIQTHENNETYKLHFQEPRIPKPTWEQRNMDTPGGTFELVKVGRPTDLHVEKHGQTILDEITMADDNGYTWYEKPTNMGLDGKPPKDDHLDHSLDNGEDNTKSEWYEKPNHMGPHDNPPKDDYVDNSSKREGFFTSLIKSAIRAYIMPDTPVYNGPSYYTPRAIASKAIRKVQQWFYTEPKHHRAAEDDHTEVFNHTVGNVMGVDPNDTATHSVPMGEMTVDPNDTATHKVPMGEMTVDPNDTATHSEPVDEKVVDPNDTATHSEPVDEKVVDPNDTATHSEPVDEKVVDPNDTATHSESIKEIVVDPKDTATHSEPIEEIIIDPNDTASHKDPIKEVTIDPNDTATHNVPMGEITVDSNDTAKHNEPIEKITVDPNDTATHTEPINKITVDSNDTATHSEPINKITVDSNDTATHKVPMGTITVDSNDTATHSEPINAIQIDQNDTAKHKDPINTIAIDQNDTAEHKEKINSITIDQNDTATHDTQMNEILIDRNDTATHSEKIKDIKIDSNDKILEHAMEMLNQINIDSNDKIFKHDESTQNTIKIEDETLNTGKIKAHTVETEKSFIDFAKMAAKIIENKGNNNITKHENTGTMIEKPIESQSINKHENKERIIHVNEKDHTRVIEDAAQISRIG